MPTEEEYSSGEFDECPNCGCSTPDTSIYKCKETLTTTADQHCGKVFCNECGEITLISFGNNAKEGCPNCDSFGSTIGEIRQT